MPKKYLAALKQKLPDAEFFAFSGAASPGGESVYETIFCHPDIYFFQIDTKKFVFSPNVSADMLDLLRSKGAVLIKGKDTPFGRYPNTAKYNAVRVKDNIFHDFDHTDPVIKEIICENGLKEIAVKQGYSRCSLVNINDRAVITSDKGIASAVKTEGIDALLLRPGSILLPGEKYGFIGGASGVLPDGRIIFLGDIELHPEGERIKKFLIKYSADHVILDGLPLYDAGSLLIF
ncbi:MAG: hypothetical protein PHW46_00595 [Candidatus Omnitrophica bacterium]|nr:hypothetical protein [Candidatus Omnitrophota bacterium]